MHKPLAIRIMVVLMLLIAPTTVFALEARLKDVVVTNTRDDLLLYLSVDGAFTEEMEAAIQSGVPATFNFITELFRVRNFWIDKKIAARQVTHTIKFDKLKKEFTVKRSWEADARTTQSFFEAKKLMTEIDSLQIVRLDQLDNGMHYQIRAKAELNKRTLPLNLHYVLIFMSLWDFETDWYTIDFIY